MSEQFSDGICEDWSSVMPVTPEVIKICLEVRPMIEKKVGTNFKMYFPVVYCSQVVLGMNYMVKVLVDLCGDGVCVDAKIFRDLPCHGGELTVTKVQYPKPFYDVLEIFS
ncbi:hypothetical protein Q8A67_003015 [Cirrhinus molitorella]|uniref:Uncharacterized protein n=1 Tax=Cirrhinus molitorella TaxID=172907 RepID=A0AA88Q899_9TELE|nr:hypothetical protein Q8A67_003015 [Cirrhinus molitorella]